MRDKIFVGFGLDFEKDKTNKFANNKEVFKKISNKTEQLFVRDEKVAYKAEEVKLVYTITKEELHRTTFRIIENRTDLGATEIALLLDSKNLLKNGFLIKGNDITIIM